MMLWKTDEVPGIYLSSLCTWREGRGEPADGWRGILHVILNRSRRPGWWGQSLASVVLCPKQFSSFNPGDPNADQMPAADDRVFQQILALAEKVMSGQDEDLTGGATHYHTLDTHPDWDKSMAQTAIIGNHIFFK
jgi:N-acetylmuramoyl-L-alanine amidase